VRVEVNREQIGLGVVNHSGDARKSGNGGAHGVRTAVSYEAALLQHSCYPKFETAEFHEASSGSVLSGRLLVRINASLVHKIILDFILEGTSDPNSAVESVGEARGAFFSLPLAGIYLLFS
jgi:hypothetical protein